jgi:hypothetical protein
MPRHLHDRLIISTSTMITFSQMKTPSLKAMGLGLAREFLAQLK